ncbi:trypsin-like serine protease [Candidatus Dojkabacteria bacterium]|nr:trypsin-like serine protease [Candidatus Dojkabacteria bacterium]
MKKAGDTSVNKSKRKWNPRFCLGCIFVIVLIVASLGATFGVLTYTGYTKEWTCSAVIEDSSAWDRLDCGADTPEQVTYENRADYEEIQRKLESGAPEERVASIVELSKKSVVGIGVEGDTFSSGGVVGTGFVLDDGLIATNQHVVSQPNSKYFVQVDGVDEVIDVQEIFRDQVNDIAVIRVENNPVLVPLALGDSEGVRVGEQVIAIGNPLGELSGSVTTGVISGLGRTVDINRGGFFNSNVETFDDVIQTDAAINPGNSGGPLLNLKGQVIGINFATVSGADNLSFALPINRIKSRLAELEEYGEFRMPYLGVEYRNRVVFVERQTLVAAQVINVVEGSPAENAGLEVGDFVIGFNGEDLNEKPLSQHIQSSEVGENVTLTVHRDKSNRDLEVEIGVK